jgi:hypothetical protein
MVLTPGLKFHQHSMYSFYAGRSQMRKKDCQVISVIWRFWDLRALKLHVERWWNWPQVWIWWLNWCEKLSHCLAQLFCPWYWKEFPTNKKLEDELKLKKLRYHHRLQSNEKIPFILWHSERINLLNIFCF